MLNTPPRVSALSREGKPVIAYYFNYWGAPWGRTIDRGWNGWYGRDSDGNRLDPAKETGRYQNPSSGNPFKCQNLLPSPLEPWRREIPTGDCLTYPLIGPYDSSNPEIVRWQVRNAKNAGITAFAIMMWDFEFEKNHLKNQTFDKEWWVTQNVTVPVIEQEGFKFIIGDEMVEETHIDCDYGGGNSCPTRFFDGSPTLGLNDFPVNVKNKIIEKGLTHKRYADLVANAYAALSRWKNSPSYLKIDNKPVYFIPLLEHYREYYSEGRNLPYYNLSQSEKAQKLNIALRAVEELIGEEVYWFGYDGYVSNGDPGVSGQYTCEGCANIWKGMIDGLIEAFGLSKSIVFTFDDHGRNDDGTIRKIFSPNSIEVLTGIYNAAQSAGMDMIPNIQTSYDDFQIRSRSSDDTLTQPWIKRNGDANAKPWLQRNIENTLKRSIRVHKAINPSPKFYFLSSWNATYFEGYTVEPAATWGDDASTDPYKYLKILASDLTGANFTPAPLPPGNSIDPLRLGPLGYNFAPGDINHDGAVNILDLARIINKRTSPSVNVPANTPEDLNADLKIDAADLTLFLQN